MTSPRTLLVTTVAPLVLAAAAIATLIAIIPSLPETIAVHWGADGQANRYDSPWLLVVVSAVLVLLGVGILLALGRAVARSGRVTLAVLVAAAYMLSVGVPAGMLATAWQQRDGAPVPEDATLLGLLFGTLAGAALLGALASLLLPREETDTTIQPAEALDLAPTERAYWATTMTSPRGVILLAVGAMVASVVLLLLVGAPWWSVLVAAGVLVLVMGTLVWRVRIDERGLVARGLLGWPSVRVRLADVEDVSVVHVEPLGDFGGWGVRFGTDGRMGIVVRRGEGLQVGRRGRGALVVTVDDAATAAAVLAALAERARAANA